MRHLVIVAMAVFGALLVAMAMFAALLVASGGTDKGDETKGEIKATLQAFYEALNDRDFSGAYGYLSSDCQRVLTPSEYQTRLENILEIMPIGDFVVKDIRIETLEGDEAVVRPDVTVVSWGQEVSVDWLQWVKRFVREDDHWRIHVC
jgi:hypothetical protein